MAVKNVESTLPDPQWIRAVEQELNDLRAALTQAQQDIVEARKA